MISELRHILAVLVGQLPGIAATVALGLFVNLVSPRVSVYLAERSAAFRTVVDARRKKRFALVSELAEHPFRLEALREDLGMGKFVALGVFIAAAGFTALSLVAALLLPASKLAVIGFLAMAALCSTVGTVVCAIVSRLYFLLYDALRLQDLLS